MTIYTYLANHSKNRHIDKVFIEWYKTKYTLSYITKSKEEWDGVFSECMNETETAKPVTIEEKPAPVVKKEPIKTTDEKSADKGEK